MKKLILLQVLGCALFTCVIILEVQFGIFTPAVAIITYWLFGVASVVNARKELMLPLEKLSERLAKASIHDKLTGCHNRVRLASRIPEYENHDTYAIIFFDINNFKKVNDLHGHNEGDKVLIKASNYLRYWFMYGDLYRIGGDEFIVVVPNTADLKLEKLVADWYKSLPLLNAEYKDDFKCTFSYGIGYKTSDMSFQEIMGVADEQMYIMKKMLRGEQE